MEWREHDRIRWLEASLDGARAVFTTRLGGVSEPPYESLNLGLRMGDRSDAVRTNRRRLADALGLEPRRVLFGRQIHDAGLEWREAPPEPSPFAEPGQRLGEADGQVSGAERLAMMVLGADCPPVLIAGPGGVAALHCGWRSLAAGIIARGVEAVGATAAVVGPGIGRCCYEVGDEVRARFASLGDGIASGRMLDLEEVARRLLTHAGVGEVELAGLCTRCNPDLFYSARRDGERTGRQGGLVWRPGGGAA